MYILTASRNTSLECVRFLLGTDQWANTTLDLDWSLKDSVLPINYTEKSELIAIPITESISNDIQKATGDVTIAAILSSLFSNSNADFKKMKKGDFIAIEYNQKTYMGKLHGMPEINAAMIQINGKPFYRFRNSK